MVAVLEARLDKFEKGVEKARKQAVGDFAAITAAGTNMENSLSGIAANGNKAFDAGAKGAKKLEGALNSTRMQTGNLAAQLNDIGVQLAGGQSPFLIALQQGTQINQVLGQGGARAAVGALAGAFSSLVNPVSIATIGIIALGGAAVQYFTSLLSDSEDGAKALEKQAQLIRNVAKEWGDAVPALRDYVAELDNIQKLGDLEAATKGAIGQVLDESLALLPQVRDAAVEAMTSAANSTQEARMAYAQLIADMSDVENAVDDLNSAYQNGEDTTAAMERVNRELADVFNSSVMPATGALRELLDQLAGSYANAAGQAGNLAAQAKAAAVNASQLPALGTLTPLESVRGQLTGDANAIQNARAEATKSQTQTEAEKAAEKESKRGRGARAKAISEAEREKKAVVDLIEQLEFEQRMIGATDAERAEANALRRAGAAATEEQKARISELVEATYAEREAMKASKEAMEDLRAVGRDVLEGMVSDLRAGKSAADIFANALGRIADKLMSSAFDGLFGGGSLLGNLAGRLVGGVAGADPWGGMRAPSYDGGGFTGSGSRSGGIDGKGGFPAILHPNETIIDHTKGGGGGKSVNINLNLSVSGVGDKELLSRVDSAAEKAVRRGISGYDHALPGRISQINRNPSRR